MSEPEARDGDNVVTRTAERVKKHPVVAALVALVGLLTFLFTVGDLYGTTGSWPSWISA
jgi:hypothetical protein